MESSNGEVTNKDIEKEIEEGIDDYPVSENFEVKVAEELAEEKTEEETVDEVKDPDIERKQPIKAKPKSKPVRKSKKTGKDRGKRKKEKKKKKDKYYKMIALSIAVIIIIAISFIYIYYQTFDTDSDGIFDWDDDDDDNDGMPDAWEKANNFDPLDSSDGQKDPDNDALKNTNEYDHGTDPHNPDTDSDGLNDGDEIDYRTEPLNNDTDSDRLLDGWEVKYDLDPRDASDAKLDPDNDGFTIHIGGNSIYFNYSNLHEHENGTNPKDPDTDADGIYDGWELYYRSEIEKIKTYNPAYNFSFDPLDPSDGKQDIDIDITYHPVGDGLSNTAEFLNGTNPLKPDSDGDGLNDVDEITTYNTDPNWYDSDSDLLADGWEVQYNLDPLIIDTDSDTINDSQEDDDSDGLSNFKEYVVGTDPYLSDTDLDGMDDGWEVSNDLDPLKMDAQEDYDNDSLRNSLENKFGTDPFNPDTDSDLLKDGDEAALGWPGELIGGIFYTDSSMSRYYTDPLSSDTDSDGLPDYDEVRVYLSNATNTDTDGDGLSDFDEIKIERTNASRVDTDSDGLNDTDELNGTFGYFTNPNKADTDTDGLLDGEEIITDFYPETKDVEGTDPLKTDTDGDGLPDGWEAKFGKTGLGDKNYTLIQRFDSDHETSLLSTADTDMDGDLDVSIWIINPLNKDDAVYDPDHDTYDKTKFTNLKEFQENTYPLNWDTDGDLMSDGWEVTFDLDPNDASDAELDPDGDGIIYFINGFPYSDDFTNFEEYSLGVDLDNDSIIDKGTTNPNLRDSDQDSVEDYEEFWFADHDNDGLVTGWELLFKGDLQDGYSPKFDGGKPKYVGEFDPYDNDTDDDLILDGDEDPDLDEITNILEHGSDPSKSPGSSDPTDPNSIPIPSRSASRQCADAEIENIREQTESIKNNCSLIKEIQMDRNKIYTDQVRKNFY